MRADRISRDRSAEHAAYRIRLPDNPFANVGRPGYEAEDRELARLAVEVGLIQAADKPKAGDQSDEHEQRGKNVATE